MIVESTEAQIKHGSPNIANAVLQVGFLNTRIMNITVNKIKRELKKNHGWDNLDNEEQKWFIDGLIKDTLLIVDEQLRAYKGISIKKK